MKEIRISELHFVGENERGTTYEFKNKRIGVQLLGLRKAGSVNGRHYHAGRSIGKNPEVFILLSGEIELFARNLLTKEEIREEIKSPKIIEIEAFVWHEIKAITDIVFIEFNSIEEHAGDTEYDIIGSQFNF